MASAHETLDREDGVLGVRNLLVPGRLAYQAFAFIGETDNRRRGAAALLINKHLGLGAFHNGDNRICGPKVNSYDLV
jgi:hypothetical protein